MPFIPVQSTGHSGNLRKTGGDPPATQGTSGQVNPAPTIPFFYIIRVLRVLRGLKIRHLF